MKTDNVVNRLDYAYIAGVQGWRCTHDLEVDSNL